ncbi:Scr1 family TA system antitoxin-like transcriptional regulator [Streptomyces sp. NPDC052109]|uniref:Scr1 family TA system antitoxin-like transcriptional regulator n=1 Tax=Streptomyces sp. NPDC052109 TaxID=3155527 RepID=UPI00341573EF
MRKARRGPHAAHFEKAPEAQKRAESSAPWSPGVFPGLLQTASYARTLVRSAHPAAFDEWAEEKVTARPARARRLRRCRATGSTHRSPGARPSPRSHRLDRRRGREVTRTPRPHRSAERQCFFAYDATYPPAGEPTPVTSS